VLAGATFFAVAIGPAEPVVRDVYGLDKRRRPSTTRPRSSSGTSRCPGAIDWFCDGVCNCDGPREEPGCSDTFKPTCP